MQINKIKVMEKEKVEMINYKINSFLIKNNSSDFKPVLLDLKTNKLIELKTDNINFKKNDLEFVKHISNGSIKRGNKILTMLRIITSEGEELPNLLYFFNDNKLVNKVFFNDNKLVIDERIDRFRKHTKDEAMLVPMVYRHHAQTLNSCIDFDDDNLNEYLRAYSKCCFVLKPNSNISITIF